jgi:glycosyltransferase involved in cell wall biosynthesis
VVGLPARLDPVKGHEVFVTAAAELRRRGHRLALVVVGSGRRDVLDGMQRRAAELGLDDLVLQRQAGETTAIYNASDVVVLPSLWGPGLPERRRGSDGLRRARRLRRRRSPVGGGGRR